jgi:WD40 repeat protein
MSYCFQPHCPSPKNQPQATTCQSCGTPLLLKNRYRAMKLLGQGNFGRTFLVVDQTQAHKPRRVAKQFLPREYGTGTPEKAAQLFQQEAALLAQLGGHPQIPNLLDYLEQDGCPYVVQDYIAGVNLAQELKIEGIWPEPRLRKLLKELLPVLDFMHQRQVIHRDIKPDNIIARPSAPLALVDFGAAKVVTGTSLARTGTLIGSANYAAPEQAAGKASFACDLYSLGVTCLHLFTGVSPFDLYDLNEDNWAWQDYTTQPISTELTEILNRMVAPALKHRYATAAEVLADLKHLPGPATTPLPAQPNPPKPLDQKPATQPKLEPKLEQHSSKSAPSRPSPPMSAQPAPATPKTSPKSTPSLPQWHCVGTLESHTRSVHAVAWHPSQAKVASASADGTVKIWHPSSGGLLRTLGENDLGSCDAVAFSHDGEMLASAGFDGNIRLWQSYTGFASTILKGHGPYVTDLAFSRDGQWLASTSYDNTLRLWNLGFNQRLFLWQLVSAQTTQVFKNIHNGWVCAVAFSPDSRLVATVGEDGTVQIRRLPQGHLIKTLTGHERMTQAVVFSANGQWLASSGKDKTIRIWQVSTGRLLHTLPIKSEANALSFCNQDRTLVSGQTDCNLHLWQVSDGQKQGILGGHGKLVYSLRSNPTGDYLVSGSEDKTVKIWQLQSATN